MGYVSSREGQLVPWVHQLHRLKTSSRSFLESPSLRRRPRTTTNGSCEVDWVIYRKTNQMTWWNILFLFSPLFSFKQLKTTFCKVKDLWGTDLTPWTISGSRIRPQLPDLLGDVTCDEKGNFQLGSLCVYIYIWNICLYIRCTVHLETWGVSTETTRGTELPFKEHQTFCCLLLQTSCRRSIFNSARIQSYPRATDDGQTLVG